jgi:hypothetical protein
MSKTGPEHVALKKMVGEWTVAESMWMGPGAQAMTSNGKATVSEVLGGKWVRQDYQGQMMGQPFTGMLLSGYDTVEKKYVATWVDSMSTMMGILKGESSDGGKTITYTSRMEHCPMTNGPVDMRYSVTSDSDDRFTMVCFQKFEGQPEFKAMELVYTRAKPTTTK